MQWAELRHYTVSPDEAEQCLVALVRGGAHDFSFIIGVNGESEGSAERTERQEIGGNRLSQGGTGKGRARAKRKRLAHQNLGPSTPSPQSHGC
jgi:hypothetical protein